MSQIDVMIDVHEVMEHLQDIGGSAAFTLNAYGSGALDLLGAPTMRWQIYPEFVLKFRALGRETARDQVVKATMDYFADKEGARFDHRFNAMMAAAGHLKSIGAKDE